MQVAVIARHHRSRWLRKHRRPISAALAALVVGASAIALSVSGAAPATHTLAIGIHLPDSDSSSSGRSAWSGAVTSTELAIGGKLDLVATGLQTFQASFPSWEATSALSTNHPLLLNWAMGYAPGIAAGTLDSTFISRAAAIKAYGATLIVAYAPGMDTGNSVGVGTTPANFIAAWKHTKAIFDTAHVTNVKWAWCPSTNAWSAGTAMQWYPGNAYVDFVCAQGAPAVGAGAASFATEFGGFMSDGGATGKALMVSSFGAALGSDSANSAWIDSAFDTLTTSSPPITYAVYDDSGATTLSTPAGLASYVSGVARSHPVVPPPVLPGGPLVPGAGTLLGAGLNQTLQSTEQSAWAGLEAASGSKLDLASALYAWGTTMPTWREAWHIANGRIPLISWGGYSTTAITSGSQDTYIRNTALGIKALGSTVFLRWFWEMDGNFFASTAGTPTQFKAAWVHIRNIFTSVGATNVAWVWSPTAYGFATGVAQPFYPGASQVDWIAADGFNSGPQLGTPSSSFASIFGGFYSWASTQGKPLMVAATGTTEGSDPTAKATWIHDMGAAVKVLYPDIRAVDYFDHPQNLYTDPTIFQWQVDTSAQSMAAWNALTTDPFFSHNHVQPLATAAVTGTSPSSGTTAGGTTVTITGSGLTGASSVVFGTNPAPTFTVVDNGHVSATVPAGTAGVVDVRVTTATGMSTVAASDRFTYTTPTGTTTTTTTAPTTTTTPTTAPTTTTTGPGGSSTTTTPTTAPTDTTTPTTGPPPQLPSPAKAGYWMLGADGHAYAFGNAVDYGSANSPSLALAPRHDAKGYWIVNAFGTVTGFGSAVNHGGNPPLVAGEQVSTMSATPSGNGYWLFTNRGRVFPYGDARSFGDMSGVALNGPIVASVATPTGHGYYLIGTDGGVFSFGDARFHGSTGNLHLNRPIVGISPTADNRGYWLVASDGGVFAFSAPFRGSMGSSSLNRPVNGLVAYGNGYLMVASDGGVFDFSNKRFLGSLADDPPTAPVIGIAAFATN